MSQQARMDFNQRKLKRLLTRSIHLLDTGRDSTPEYNEVAVDIRRVYKRIYKLKCIKKPKLRYMMRSLNSDLRYLSRLRRPKP